MSDNYKIKKVYASNSLRKTYHMTLFKFKCPNCNKRMIRHKQMQKFWWSCSGDPHCTISARDYKGKPEFLKKEELLARDFLNQLDFIRSDINDLRALILIRLIKNKQSVSALPEKYISMYYKLIEPVIASIVFTKCHRCKNTLDAEHSLKLDEDKYLCDWCWGH